MGAGNTRMYDPLCTFLARTVETVVVSVDYAMAPEHHAPKAAHDSVDSLRWLGEHADSLGGGASRLAVSGDSAGGNLAAIVCQVVRDEGGPTICHQALPYPAPMRPGASPPSWSRPENRSSNRAKIDVFLDLYLGPDGLAADDPLVSPLWAASHANLPPELVQWADLDPLRDGGRLYGQRLAAAGVPVRHTNYVGTPHGFASLPGATTIGHQHRGELVCELRRHLHPEGPSAVATSPLLGSPRAHRCGSGSRRRLHLSFRRHR